MSNEQQEEKQCSICKTLKPSSAFLNTKGMKKPFKNCDKCRNLRTAADQRKRAVARGETPPKSETVEEKDSSFSHSPHPPPHRSIITKNNNDTITLTINKTHLENFNIWRSLSHSQIMEIQKRSYTLLEQPNDSNILDINNFLDEFSCFDPDSENFALLFSVLWGCRLKECDKPNRLTPKQKEQKAKDEAKRLEEIRQNDKIQQLKEDKRLERIKQDEEAKQQDKANTHKSQKIINACDSFIKDESGIKNYEREITGDGVTYTFRRF